MIVFLVNIQERSKDNKQDSEISKSKVVEIIEVDSYVDFSTEGRK